MIIDGNNLLYAMYDHAPLPNIGRETLVRVIERWAKTGTWEITLVFDGPEPRGAMAQLMRSSELDVRFSAPHSADDIIVAIVHETKDPGRIRVVSGDKAIRAEAVSHRCRYVSCVDFVAELFPAKSQGKAADKASPPEKPEPDASTDQWLETFGYDATDPDSFDGLDAMRE